MNEHAENSLDVAVIGMSARFAMSANVEQLWDNLVQGKDCITRDQSKYKANYVAAYGKVDNIADFDADFFGFNKREAMNADPQQRFLMEGVYEALEDAGYNSHKYAGKIGLYSTTDEHLYVWNYLMREQGDWYLNFHLNEFHFDGTFSTLIAYKLNLQGPCVLTKYACASSLAAIHYAYQGLLNYECDMAVAGGVCLEPEQEGCNCFDNTVSRSGYVKAFDADADGLVKAAGQGLVVLKRLEDALSDRDRIICVLKGTNLNNDGNRKVGFAAPSVQGQEEAIRDALLISNVKPVEVGYFETHGTGTVLGDTVELRALKNVFKPNSADQKVYIGSMKSNIGHTSSASGVANFIKASLMLNKKIMPPSIHFHHPNAELLDKDCPVVVNDQLRAWEGESPKIAGVSSFGMGGANAIAILSEHEQEEHHYTAEEELFVISGRTDTSLLNNCMKLADHLKHHDVHLKDAAYTLQAGRGSFEHKFYAVCRDKAALIEKLEQAHKSKKTSPVKAGKIVFAFSGSGSHGDSMGRELYESNVIFRREMDRCFHIVHAIAGKDYKPYYLASGTDNQAEDHQLAMMFITFASGYSLAKLWIELGIQPDLLLGHSLGEYIAACISGIFTLEIVLEVLWKRAGLFHTLPEGTMLGVALTKDKLEALLTDGVTIGAENGEKRFLVSGLDQDMERFIEALEQNRIRFTRLPVNRAGHCPAIQRIENAYREVLQSVHFAEGSIPIVSTYTGKLIEKQEMATTDYWIDQMINPVTFHSAVKEIASKHNAIFIEMGLSDQLTDLIRKTIANDSAQYAVSSLKESKAKNAREGLLHAVGKLYCRDVEIMWDKLYNEKPYRVSLPTYQFDRKPYWKYKKHVVGDNQNVVYSDTEQEGSKEPEVQAEEAASDCRDATDIALVDIFKEVLGIEKIGIYDDLYEYGFDSLSVVMVTSKVETVLGKTLSIKDIYTVTTIADLSDLLATKTAEEKVPEEKEVQLASRSIDDMFKEM
ncbi:acyltransferase domain-containing protein [Paenibacillus sp. MER 180]|uniref:type I polyketide synthase n=1 Tax=Paenibacillus sp. MER 180 TaxID=2939570 RepID=UPI002040FCE2|nr:type I polyketide synthase [Paenibacillus sp. MER 180]MCM3291424.1 acyltransferase domain-containing protein [Paenibacillus sp. MER 180]